METMSFCICNSQKYGAASFVFFFPFFYLIFIFFYFFFLFYVLRVRTSNLLFCSVLDSHSWEENARPSHLAFYLIPSLSISFHFTCTTNYKTTIGQPLPALPSKLLGSPSYFIYLSPQWGSQLNSSLPMPVKHPKQLKKKSSQH